MSEKWWDLKKKQNKKKQKQKQKKAWWGKPQLLKKNGNECKSKTKDYLKRHWATEAQNAPKSQFLVFIGKKKIASGVETETCFFDIVILILGTVIWMWPNLTLSKSETIVKHNSSFLIKSAI